MELVDVLDSKSSVFGRAGSSPATGTIRSPETSTVSGLFSCPVLFVLNFVLISPTGLDSFLFCDIIQTANSSSVYMYRVNQVFRCFQLLNKPRNTGIFLKEIVTFLLFDYHI